MNTVGLQYYERARRQEKIRKVKYWLNEVFIVTGLLGIFIGTAIIFSFLQAQ